MPVLRARGVPRRDYRRDDVRRRVRSVAEGTRLNSELTAPSAVRCVGCFHALVLDARSALEARQERNLAHSNEEGFERLSN